MKSFVNDVWLTVQALVAVYSSCDRIVIVINTVHHLAFFVRSHVHSQRSPHFSEYLIRLLMTLLLHNNSCLLFSCDWSFRLPILPINVSCKRLSLVKFSLTCNICGWPFWRLRMKNSNDCIIYYVFVWIHGETTPMIDNLQFFLNLGLFSFIKLHVRQLSLPVCELAELFQFHRTLELDRLVGWRLKRR